MALNTKENSRTTREMVCVWLVLLITGYGFMLTMFLVIATTGRGVYAYPDGRTYTGEYKDERPHGRGTETAADGSILYDGYWTLGEFVGKSES
jgi:hypothetical protein